MVKRKNELSLWELKAYKSQINTNKWVKILTCLAVVLTILQIWVTWSINETNNRLYLQTIRPELSITPAYSTDETGRLVIDPGRLATINLDNSTGEMYGFKIVNLGKMDSGMVTIQVLNNWSSTFEGHAYSENIVSGQSQMLQLILTTKECHEWQITNRMRPEERAKCTKSRLFLPSGEGILELKVTCSNCEPEVIHFNIPTCFSPLFPNNCSSFR